MFADFYDLLGIPSTATSAEIREAYRYLALIYHPDIPTGNPEAFKAIVIAYATLRDPDRRASYDLDLSPCRPASIDAHPGKLADILPLPIRSVIASVSSDAQELATITTLVQEAWPYDLPRYCDACGEVWCTDCEKHQALCVHSSGASSDRIDCVAEPYKAEKHCD